MNKPIPTRVTQCKLQKGLLHVHRDRYDELMERVTELTTERDEIKQKYLLLDQACLQQQASANRANVAYTESKDALRAAEVELKAEKAHSAALARILESVSSSMLIHAQETRLGAATSPWPTHPAIGAYIAHLAKGG